MLVRDDVMWLEPRFRHDTPDPVWLREAGLNDWLVVTRDKKIRTRPGERRAIEQNNVGCFIVAQKRALSPWDYLKLLALTLEEMERRFAVETRPFIFNIGSTGILTRVS